MGQPALELKPETTVTQSAPAEYGLISEMQDVVPPPRKYKEFQTTYMQMLPTATLEDIVLVINELKIGVITLGTARRLVKSPNIVLAGFNSDDYAPPEEALG